MRPMPVACPTRSVASSGVKDRSSQATPSSFASAAIAGTAAVIISIAANGATVALSIPHFDIPHPHQYGAAAIPVAGRASQSNRSATTAPIGVTGERRPAGLQRVGPHRADRLIAFARLFAAESGGFVPLPALP